MSWQEYRSTVRADLTAAGLSRWTPLKVISRPEVHVVRLIRITEWLRGSRSPLKQALYPIARYLLFRTSKETGIQIPPGVAGPGLSVAHFGSVVINSSTRIGRYCRIHSATNIGSAGSHKAPRIGDYVYIGPGAVIYGDISIGDRTVIGANSVVGRDVPPGVTVAGSPARIIAERGSESIMPEQVVAIMTQPERWATQ